MNRVRGSLNPRDTIRFHEMVDHVGLACSIDLLRVDVVRRTGPVAITGTQDFTVPLHDLGIFEEAAWILRGGRQGLPKMETGCGEQIHEGA